MFAWHSCEIIAMNFQGHPGVFLSYGWSRSVHSHRQSTATIIQTENYLYTFMISLFPSWEGMRLGGFTTVRLKQTYESIKLTKSSKMSPSAHFLQRIAGCSDDRFSWRISDAVLTSFIIIAGFSWEVRLPSSGQPHPQCSWDTVGYLVGLPFIC